MRPVEIREDGLLWLINRVVFHPRGYSLGYDPVTKDFALLGDGTETFTFGAESVEAPHLARIRELMP
jgi:hypothetical protein